MARLVLLAALGLVAAVACAQSVDPHYFNGLQWRLLGPFRGGRSLAATGVPGQPEKFYFGAVGGGLWQSNNLGRTWVPIFDKESAASIGAIAVAPSDPNVIYVGSGEADMRSDIQQGDGMYKSVDAGKTWSHIGLADTRQIGKIVVDPSEPDTAYVAALGHQYGPNTQRGVFKTVDGGKTWARILYKNQDTGAIDLEMDPADPNVLYASLWQTRRPPWSVYPPSNGPGSGLYKSSDAGAHWTQIVGKGLPAQVGRIGLSISRSEHNRIYACVDTKDPKLGGVYRSDDAGDNWQHTSGDGRIWGRGWYFMGITADPRDPDTVYVMNTSAYRSTDGGKHFTAFKGAPGGDDYHTCWISPDDPTRMVLASDQGTIVTVDGGSTWSSWYNQPTGQFYHIVTDNRDPYWVYGSQQDSGAMALPSRTIHTGIGPMYQRPIDAGGESGTIAPDPLHPGLLFSSTGFKEQIETAWSRSSDPTLGHDEEEWRNEWTMPIAISPANPRAIYACHQRIFRSGDGGESWRIISPDLTRKGNFDPPNLDPPTLADHDAQPRRGVVYWIALSPIRAKEVWAGTDDGLIWLTMDDGLHWKDVTPKALTPWSKVGIIDASHFRTDTAYAAIDRHRLDDNRPYIYRTHDSGQHWTLITRGIPPGQFVNVVREDPRQAGLLYAGTDWGVFVSVDDGDHWQSLQLNLPAASVRDIVFGNGDVVVGTHGRAIWVLDDPAVLRQLRSRSSLDTALFRPSPARLFQRAGTFGFGAFDEGTPFPAEEPRGQNPPWGAVFDYALGAEAKVDLQILDAHGRQMRRFSSEDKLAAIDVNQLSIPAYWVHPGSGLSGLPGGHRFVWDLRHKGEGGPMVPPGNYSVRMTVNGKPYSQPFQVVRDRRIPVTDADLRAQFAFELQIADEIALVASARDRAAALEKRHLSSDLAKRLRLINGSGRTSLAAVANQLGVLSGAVQTGPAAPINEWRRLFQLYKQRAAADIQELQRLERASSGSRNR